MQFESLHNFVYFYMHIANLGDFTLNKLDDVYPSVRCTVYVDFSAFPKNEKNIVVLYKSSIFLQSVSKDRYNSFGT